MIGRLIDGRYQVRSRIARGGMATVYLATDLRLERRVAIKIMHGHLADDSQFKERFIQEARSAARLAHPNVVNVFDQGQDSDMAYLVMEYLPGITLRDLLTEHHILTTEQTLDILEAVLGGLAAAHKAGIVHRDLKPENVLLADDGRIKIGDFGLARAASANTATGAALLGTIAYLSPELVTRGVADARSDIYAVGIMMYEMLAGEQPFKGEQPMQIAYQHANDSVPTPSTKNPKVPAELDELVLWATARDPEQRPRDARAMLDQLFETHSQLMTALPATPSSQRTMVMPRAVAPTTALVTANVSPNNDETAVIGSHLRKPSASAVLDHTSALAVKSGKRRSRGWLLFVGLVLVAALAAGTGWYFGAGPGSRSIIPASIAGLSVADATGQLKKLGLAVSVTPGVIDSPTVAVGLVVNTTPKIGTAVAHGGTVTLLVSTGPRPLNVPAFAGMTEERAKAAITAAPFAPRESLKQFDAKVASSTVIDALAADGSSLAGVATYGELQPVTLVVSVGAIPDLTGLSVADATAKLKGVGLSVGAVDAAEFSDKVPAGAVIHAQLQSGAAFVRVGGAVDLITSEGVEQIAVPNVVGKTWADAKPALQAAGFLLEYNIFADAAPNLFTVTKITPGGGTLAPKGSTVKVNFSS